ncbi:MAG: response regulator [Candidatus Obscuribacterales bacterium]
MSDFDLANSGFEAQKRLAANPGTDSGILRIISKETRFESILVTIAENRSTPVDVLSRLVNHASSEVRIGVADNPECTVEILQILKGDLSVDVRYSLADNHNIPLRILHDLAEDDNPYVADRALRTLNNRSRSGISIARAVGAEETRSGSITVLVAEDNRHIQFLIASVLKGDPDLEILGSTENGDDTVFQAGRRGPAVVLMDISMPGMDGVEATNKIKENNPDTRIIMVTGSDNVEDIRRAFRAGADGYFLKSTPLSELPRCIRTVFSGACWLDPGISSTILRKCFETGHSAEPTIKAGDKLMAIDTMYRQIDDLVVEEEFEQAILVCRAASFLSERFFGRKAKVTARCLAKLADVYYSMREFQNSEHLLLQAMESNEDFLDEADESADYVLSSLGKMSQAAGNMQQAELYYAWSLRIRERMGDSEKIEEARQRIANLD